MTALADIANIALPLKLGTVRVTHDGLLGIDEQPTTTSQQFLLDEVLYHAELRPEGGGTRLRIWAELGYVPFSFHSRERRSNVLRILRGTQSCRRACFAVDRTQKILAVGESLSDEPMTIDAMVYEIVLFIQEARPFIRVLGDYL